MSEPEPKQNYVELVDISEDTPIAKAPLAAITHLPRTGERIFLPLHQPSDWAAYTVLRVEYFLGGTLSASDEALESPGMVKITLFVERSR